MGVVKFCVKMKTFGLLFLGVYSDAIWRIDDLSCYQCDDVDIGNCEPSFCMPNEDKCYFAKLQTDDGEKLFRGCTTENLPKTACQCLPDGGFVCTSVCGESDCDAKENLVEDLTLEDCPPPSNSETTSLAQTTTTVAHIDTTTEKSIEITTESGTTVFYASVCLLATILM